MFVRSQYRPTTYTEPPQRGESPFFCIVQSRTTGHVKYKNFANFTASGPRRTTSLEVRDNNVESLDKICFATKIHVPATGLDYDIQPLVSSMVPSCRPEGKLRFPGQGRYSLCTVP